MLKLVVKKRLPWPSKDARRKGNIIVLSAMVMIIIFGFLAFTVDLGYVMVRKGDLQAAVDAATLAGVEVLSDGETAVANTIDEMLGFNDFDPETTGQMSIDYTYGTWDIETREFTAVSDIEDATSLQVDVTVDSITSFFGSIFNKESYTVTGSAIATKAGSAPRDIILVIDCSSSMGATMSNGEKRIENAATAAQALIDELGPNDRVSLAVYSWEDSARNKFEKTGRVETLLDFDHTATLDRIGELEQAEYTSGTNIGGGFRAGLDIFLNSTPRPAPENPLLEEEVIMVMLTDGQVNKVEPYPEPNDGPTGMLPPLPFNDGPTCGGGDDDGDDDDGGKKKKKKKSSSFGDNDGDCDEDYNASTAVTKWANTIKARGITIHSVTLGNGAYDPIMVDAATVPSSKYYHHIANGGDDYEELLETYKGIGQGTNSKLVK